MALKVGVITMNERISARPVITWLGGDSCVPTALRTNESTTTIRVKDVTSTSSAGASESTVSRNTISSVVETFSGFWASRIWPGRSESGPFFSWADAEPEAVASKATAARTASPVFISGLPGVDRLLDVRELVRDRGVDALRLLGRRGSALQALAERVLERGALRLLAPGRQVGPQDRHLVR